MADIRVLADTLHLLSCCRRRRDCCLGGGHDRLCSSWCSSGADPCVHCYDRRRWRPVSTLPGGGGDAGSEGDVQSGRSVYLDEGRNENKEVTT